MLLHFSFSFSVGRVIDISVVLLPGSPGKEFHIANPVFGFPIVGKGDSTVTEYRLLLLSCEFLVYFCSCLTNKLTTRQLLPPCGLGLFFIKL